MKAKTTQHPAEVTTFMGGLFILLAYLGLNIPEGVLAAGLIVVSLLPAVVTWLVNIYRSALADLDDTPEIEDLGRERVGE